jgi:Response regulator receiver domain
LTTLLIVNRLDDGTSIVATTPRIAGRPDETDGHTETIVNTPSVVSRILVVDDDASVGAAVRMILDRGGCEAVHVTDADTAIRAFEASRFDLVMVDIFMPTVNGLKAIAGISNPLTGPADRRDVRLQISRVDGSRSGFLQNGYQAWRDRLSAQAVHAPTIDDGNQREPRLRGPR